MFCPSCRDEFRPGFTRCERCNQDLVESLDEVVEGKTAQAGGHPPLLVQMVEFCGFVDLDEARKARELLRDKQITADILIRESPNTSPNDSVVEEFWLRVDARRYRQAVPILGYDEAGPGDLDSAESTTCGKCGATIAAAESFCSSCGARFGDSR